MGYLAVSVSAAGVAIAGHAAFVLFADTTARMLQATFGVSVAVLGVALGMLEVARALRSPR